MLDQNDLWLLEEEMPVDEPADAMLTMPKIRELVDSDRYDDELGLRSILERPEALSKAWRQSTHDQQHHRPSKTTRRHLDVLRAA
jgi:hypothetical protein